MITTKEPTISEIKRVLFDPDIYNRISDDTTPELKDFLKLIKENNYKFDTKNYCGFYLDNKIIGLADNEDSDFHYQILKKYRHKYAKECLKLAISYFNKPLSCKIPTLYKEVINFALNNGFVEVCKLNLFYIKNNTKYNYIKLCLK